MLLSKKSIIESIIKEGKFPFYNQEEWPYHSNWLSPFVTVTENFHHKEWQKSDITLNMIFNLKRHMDNWGIRRENRYLLMNECDYNHLDYIVSKLALIESKEQLGRVNYFKFRKCDNLHDVSFSMEHAKNPFSKDIKIGSIDHKEEKIIIGISGLWFGVSNNYSISDLMITFPELKYRHPNNIAQAITPQFTVKLTRLHPILKNDLFKLEVPSFIFEELNRFPEIEDKIIVWPGHKLNFGFCMDSISCDESIVTDKIFLLPTPL